MDKFHWLELCAFLLSKAAFPVKTTLQTSTNAVTLVGWHGFQRLVDAARLRRARRRMRCYFFGSGVILAILYLIAAAFFIRLYGVELTHYWSTAMLAAGVLLGGTYAIVMVLWLGARFIRRLIKRQPIVEVDD